MSSTNPLLNRTELRVGDEVYFVNKNSIKIVGYITKVNRKSCRLVQTNDEYRLSNTAFGYRGGRRVGGKGVKWTIAISDSGLTPLRFTEQQKADLSDSRKAMVNRNMKTSACTALISAIKQCRAAGYTDAQIRGFVDLSYGDNV
jgi:hypothetical protein